MNPDLRDDDVAAIERLRDARLRIVDQVGRCIVGQREVLDQLLVALFAGGNVLLVGVPGLAKTLLVRTLSQSLALQFSRIQFTPDLMPSDITGIEVIHEDRATGQRQLKFHAGPIFANLVLADEINRTSPKTQAALLEAMQELQVTVGGVKHPIPPPFLVMATQNPIEQEGTYPLPEALLDRFMMQVWIHYPDEAEELEIVRRTTSDVVTSVEPVLNANDILELATVVRRVPVADHVARHALRMIRLTRAGDVPGGLGGTRDVAEGAASTGQPSDRETRQNGWLKIRRRSQSAEERGNGDADIREFLRAYVKWGAGPRASQFLVLAGKAIAALDGRFAVELRDIDAAAAPVLRHRLRLNYAAAAAGITADDVIGRLVEALATTDSRDASCTRTLFRSPDVEPA
jgi:MoxR-like ATPase